VRHSQAILEELGLRTLSRTWGAKQNDRVHKKKVKSQRSKVFTKAAVGPLLIRDKVKAPSKARSDLLTFDF
jgi:hypothetical protein